MTTTIRDGYDPEPDHTGITADGTKVRMHVRYKKVASIAAVGVLPRDEFLRAVETELNVIVINRADLPRVLPLGSDPTALRIEDDNYDIDYDHYAEALRRLAIVEHAKAHPPVDQADVDALADAIAHTTGTTREDQTHLARRLVQAGVRPPKAD